MVIKTIRRAMMTVARAGMRVAVSQHTRGSTYLEYAKRQQRQTMNLKSLAVIVGLALGLGLVTAAQANLVDAGYAGSDQNSSPDGELVFLQSLGYTGLDYLDKYDVKDGWDGDFNKDGVLDVTKIFGERGSKADIEWNLTGTGYELAVVLVKDGNIKIGSATLKGYRIYTVSDDQKLIGSGTVEYAYNDKPQGISHISFWGVTAVPDGGATLLLLGSSLLGLGILRRLIRI